MSSSFIAGTGYHHPDRVVTNQDFEKVADTTDEWIREHTGIVERRYADALTNTSDLGVRATQNALDDAGWERADIELLVCATSTPDCLLPATASFICEKLELPAVAFDINAACSGFLYALAVARGMMQSHGYERAAVCTADKYSRVIDPSDRKNSIFFGDSAATVLLSTERPERGLEIVDIALKNRNKGADLVKTPVGGYFAMDGPAVKRIAFAGFVDTATGMLDKHGLTTDDLRAFIAHQANLRLLETLADTLGINGNRHWHNVERAGNQGAAGVITSFCEGLEEYRDELSAGDLFLLSTYGSGFTSGSALLRWVS